MFPIPKRLLGLVKILFKVGMVLTFQSSVMRGEKLSGPFILKVHLLLIKALNLKLNHEMEITVCVSFRA